MKTANRLHSVEEYYFSKKLREVRELMNQGHDVINMGIGSPDLTPPESALQALTMSLHDAGAHKYQSYQGLPELREAIRDFYKRFYNVSLDANSNILPLLGSKEGIFHISMAFLNSGDQVLIPNPGYPTYSSVTRLVEAEPIYYSLTAENNWLPDLNQLRQMDLQRVKLMWITYPNMPTGARASREELGQIVDFARENNILLINDNPYSLILNQEPISIMEVPGAEQIALELNSLSKSFNIAGWRVGMVVGNPEFIQSIIKVKSNMDSGMFYGIQKGAIAALNVEQEWLDKLNETYLQRKLLIKQLTALLNTETNDDLGGMFVWAKLPDHIKSAEKYIDQILNKHHIFITPGTVFGSQGEGYIRFSLCVPEDQIKEAIRRISNG